MPGIPKSTACQKCKQRRIKCDLSWPTCSPCAQRGFACPGPSSLLKFINVGDSGSSSGSSRGGSISSKSNDGRSERKGSDDSTGDDPKKTAIKAAKLRKVARKAPAFVTKDDQRTQWSTFRLVVPQETPSQSLTTTSDRVAHRLIGTLEHGTVSGKDIPLQMCYLPLLPKRLSESPCLRDAVELYCTAYSAYRCRDYSQSRSYLPEGRFMSMPQYGKTLRSLQRALDSDQALAVETLAAVTILERTQAYFDREQLAEDHLRGLANLVAQKGVPNLKDELDVAVTNENRGVLYGLGTIRGYDEIMQGPEWKEALDHCKDEYWKLCDEPCPGGQLDFVLDVAYDWPRWIELSKQIHQDPTNEEMMELATNLLVELKELALELERVVTPYIKEAFQKGRIVEEPAPEAAVTDTCYTFKTAITAQEFSTILSMRLIIFRFIYDIGNLYGPAQETVYAEYRGVCVHILKMVPYIFTLESFNAGMLLVAPLLSFEAARGEEREYLTELVLYTDQFRKRLPTDRDEIAVRAQRFITRFTGRPQEVS